MNLRRITTLGDHIAHKLRRNVHVMHAIVYIVAERAVEQLIKPLHLAHTNGRCHVLRLDMESSRNGFADLITVINRFLLYTKWNKNMHDIRPIARGMHNLRIIIRKTEIVFVAQRLEYRNIELFCGEITICQIVLLRTSYIVFRTSYIPWSVPTKHPYFVTSFPQFACKTLRRDRRTVVRRVKTVNYK